MSERSSSRPTAIEAAEPAVSRLSATYRTRYAPSPTGAMHLGHARTALVTWLRARSMSGKIVMRIEDLDTPRVRAGAEEAMLAEHEWLGLDWDEGPIRQSRRLQRYDEVLADLASQERIFECTCSRREIREASAPHGDPGVYPGTCRAGSLHPNRPAALRFRMEKPENFVDEVQGAVDKGYADDFVVQRSDGLHAYQLAVVVDDHDMRITEVIRGVDLLSSTGRQIALYRALGWEPPAFAHVPLVIGEDGARLAKRHGAIGISDYREAGWSPERVLGMLAVSLGLVAEVSASPISLSELLQRFQRFPLARMNREAFRPPKPADHL